MNKKPQPRRAAEAVKWLQQKARRPSRGLLRILTHVAFLIPASFALAAFAALGIAHAFEWVPGREAVWSAVTVEALAATLALPLSADLINRVQDRFRSKKLSQIIAGDRSALFLRWLAPPHALLAVLFLLLTSESTPENDPGILWRLGATWVVVNLALTIVALMVFLGRALARYLADAYWAVEELDKAIGKELKPTSPPNQTAYLESLQGLSNIASFAAQDETRLDLLEAALGKTSDVTGSLELLLTSHPSHFTQLTVAEKFRDLRERNPTDFHMRASMIPDDVYVGVTAAVKVIERAHSVAIRANNQSGADLAAHELIRLLDKLCRVSDGREVVSATIRAISRQAALSMETKGRTAGLLTHVWFLHVFLESPAHYGLEAQPSYVLDAQAAVFSLARMMVREGYPEVFRGFVGSLHDGVGAYRFSPGDADLPWSIADLPTAIYEVEKDRWRCLEEERDEILEESDRIESLAQFESWVARVTDHTRSVADALPKQVADELKLRLEDTLRHGYQATVVNRSALELIVLAAYCIFCGQWGLLQILLDYHQPPDADAISAGWDPFPRIVDEVLSFALASHLDTRLLWWEDHHGSEQYINQVLAVLLLRARDLGQVWNTMPQFLRAAELARVAAADRVLDMLEKLVDAVAGKGASAGVVRGDPEDLASRAKQTFDSSREWRMAELRRRETTQSLGEQRVGGFLDAIVEGFRKAPTIWRALLEPETGELAHASVATDRLETAVARVYPRSQFFADYDVGLGGYGADIGADLSRRGDFRVVGQVLKHCSMAGSLDRAISLFPDLQNVWIIATRQTFVHWRRQNGTGLRFEGNSGRTPLPLLASYDCRGTQILIVEAQHCATPPLLVVDCSRLSVVPGSPAQFGQSVGARAEDGLAVSLLEARLCPEEYRAVLAQGAVPPLMGHNQPDSEPEGYTLLRLHWSCTLRVGQDFRGFLADIPNHPT